MLTEKLKALATKSLFAFLYEEKKALLIKIYILSFNNIIKYKHLYIIYV